MKGLIYKIFRPENKRMVYIGSTTRTKEKRFKEHQKGYKMYKNGKKDFVSSYFLIKHGDCKIELIKEVEVKDRIELETIEGEYMLIYEDLGFELVNLQIPFYKGINIINIIN